MAFEVFASAVCVRVCVFLTQEYLHFVVHFLGSYDIFCYLMQGPLRYSGATVEFSVRLS